MTFEKKNLKEVFILNTEEVKDLEVCSALAYIDKVKPWRARGKGGGDVALISYYVLTGSGQLEEETYYFASPAGKSDSYHTVCAHTLEALGYSLDSASKTVILEAFNDLRESGTRKRGLLVWAYIARSPKGIHTKKFDKVTTLTKPETLTARWLEGLAREDLTSRNSIPKEDGNSQALEKCGG